MFQTKEPSPRKKRRHEFFQRAYEIIQKGLVAVFSGGARGAWAQGMRLVGPRAQPENTATNPFWMIS